MGSQHLTTKADTHHTDVSHNITSLLDTLQNILWHQVIKKL